MANSSEFAKQKVLLKLQAMLNRTLGPKFANIQAIKLSEIQTFRPQYFKLFEFSNFQTLMDLNFDAYMGLEHEWGQAIPFMKSDC